MAQICEFGKYAIFCLYLTINPVEPVYESFYGTIHIIWCLGELIECPRFAWCAQACPKWPTKSPNFAASGHFYLFLAYFSYGIYPKRLFIHSKLYLWHGSIVIRICTTLCRHLEPLLFEIFAKKRICSIANISDCQKWSIFGILSDFKSWKCDILEFLLYQWYTRVS